MKLYFLRPVYDCFNTSILLTFKQNFLHSHFLNQRLGFTKHSAPWLREMTCWFYCLMALMSPDLSSVVTAHLLLPFQDHYLNNHSDISVFKTLDKIIQQTCWLFCLTIGLVQTWIMPQEALSLDWCSLSSMCQDTF